MSEQIDAVQRMQDYIAAHIRDELSFADIARASLYSPWYARKLFIVFTGVSPSEYVRRLKLRESALMLRDKKITVLEAAMSMGFGSVDGYRRAFEKEFGCTPGEYASNPVPLPLFTPYGVKSVFTERKEKQMETKNIFISVVTKPERKVIIKRSKSATEYWSYCQEVGCDVWGILSSIKSISGEPVCLWLPHSLVPEGTGSYVQGVEVETDYSGQVPDGFEVIKLPASQYLMFQGEPFDEEYFEDAIGEIWKAEKNYNPSPLGYMWDNSNPRIQLEPIGSRGYIELMPVKKLI